MAVIKTNFLSRCLGRQVDFNAIIPTYHFRHNNSNTNPYETGRKFKVLILLHGFSGDCNDYLNFTNIARYAEKHNLAVIMPSGFNSGYTDDSDGAKMHSFVAFELLEVCRFLFPISSKREDTYIGGLSMGAMGAGKIALAHPEVFSEVLMMSGAPIPFRKQNVIMDWFGSDKKYYHGFIPGYTENYLHSQEDAYYHAEKNILENNELPRFMIACGSEDGLLPACQYFYNALKELGYDISLSEVNGYGHQWDFWETELRNAIENGFTL